MSMRRLLVAVCLILASVGGRAIAEPPSVAGLRKTVVESYSKIDRFSISCLVAIDEISDHNPEKCLRTVCLGTVEYRFDRPTKRLAIGSGGQPELLVRNDKLFIYAGSASELPIYAELDKPHAITWDDIEEAMVSIRGQWPPGDDNTGCHVPAFLYPFLDGGADRIFSANSRALDRKNPKDNSLVTMAHPATPLFALGGEKTKLDAESYPNCIETKDNSSQWTYAFDRRSAVLCSAYGIAPYERFFGTPGSDVVVILKPTVDFNKGEVSAESQEVALELPAKAKIIAIANVRAELLRRTGLHNLEAAKSEIEDNIHSSSDEESQLLARIAKFTAKPDKNRDDPESDELDLRKSRSQKKRLEYIDSELKKLIGEAKSLDRP